MNEYESFFSFLENSYSHFELNEVLVVAHLDTDGVTSIALFKEFYREIEPELKIIQQLDDECIDELASMPQKNIILLDTGSLKLNSIKSKLSDKKVIIIDHHEIEKDVELSDNIFFINPFLFGINGSKEISTSGIVYLILRGMNPHFKKFAYLPIVGAFGDYQYQGNFKYLNRIIQQEAMEGQIIQTKKELNVFRLNSQPLSFSLTFSGDFKIPKFYRKENFVISFLKQLGIDPRKTFSQLDPKKKARLTNAVQKLTPPQLRKKLFAYHILIHPNIINDNGKLYEAKEISTYLNGLSRLFNVKLGIDFCLQPAKYLPDVKKANRQYKDEISNAMKLYYDMKNNEEIFENDFIIFVNFKEKLNPNLVGILGSMLTKGGIEQTDKIVIISAYQRNNLKISFRVQNRSKYNLNLLARKLVENHGGEAGGHKQAAGAVIKKEHEDAIIQKIKEITQDSVPTVEN